MKPRFGAYWAQGDLIALTFDLENVSGTEMQLIAQRLRNQNAAGLIHGELCDHFGRSEWENPLLFPCYHSLF